MVDLAKSTGKGPVSLTEVAASQDISLGYLEQLIAILKKAGLVESTRGAHGGYELARGPQEISVGDIVRALDGPIAPVECVAENRSHSEGCDREAECPSRAVWVKMRDKMTETLDSTSLADLI
jgi:Rrf2 family transcriptional regulator, cysteine metabolism repressor